MTVRRPSWVTAFCALSLLAALFEVCWSQQVYWTPPSVFDIEWAKKYPTASTMLLATTYFFSMVTLITAYWMMNAKNWARWTFLSVGTLRFVIAFSAGPFVNDNPALKAISFHASMAPALLMLVLGYIILFLENAREYYYAGGRPWWMVMEEEDKKKE